MSPLGPMDPAIIAAKSNDTKPVSGPIYRVIAGGKSFAHPPSGLPLLLPPTIFAPPTSKTTAVFEKTLISKENSDNEKRKRVAFEKPDLKASGGAGKSAEEPTAEKNPYPPSKRGAVEGRLPCTKKVTFSPSAQGRWISETSEGDEVSDVSLKPNYDDRHSEKGRRKCYLRPIEKVTSWPVPAALKNRDLDIVLMGPYVTFNDLIATAKINEGFCIPNTLDCSTLQIQFAAEQSIAYYIASHMPLIPEKIRSSYAKYLADMFVTSLNEFDANKSEDKTIDTFTSLFAANIRLYNTKVHELTCDSFLDLIKAPHPDTRALRVELRGYLDECLEDAEGDYNEAAELFARVVEDIRTERTFLKETSFFQSLSAKQYHTYIPCDILYAPEFDALHTALKDGSWRENEVRTLTSSIFKTPEELDRLVSLALSFFRDGKEGYSFLFAARGLY